MLYIFDDRECLFASPRRVCFLHESKVYWVSGNTAIFFCDEIKTWSVLMNDNYKWFALWMQASVSNTEP